MSMRAAVWTGPGSSKLRDVALPDVPEGWALIKTEYAGICGTSRRT
jgi:(R,R)-butanediol dehydrogenase/meso-butanediol dehydrogenase/diacetyl reductase